MRARGDGARNSSRVLKAGSTNPVIFDWLALQPTENLTGIDRMDRIFDFRFENRSPPIANQKSEI
jgi:hypothetical protein